MATFVVELYWPGVTEHAALELFGRARRAAADTSREGAAVDCLGCSLTLEDEVCLLRFEAASKNVVREVSRRAGIATGRISRQVELAPGDPERSA